MGTVRVTLVPAGPAKALLRILDRAPEAALSALA